MEHFHSVVHPPEGNSVPLRQSPPASLRLPLANHNELTISVHLHL